VTALGRGFMVDNDPSVPVVAIRNGVRLSRYVPGAQGTAIGTFLAGRAPLGVAPAVPEGRFVELSGAAFNTIYPSDPRTWFFYIATGITPAMCMYLTGIGSQYLFAARGSDGEYLDGSRNYRLTLPPDIPQSRFWSVMLYDRQTRSMLQTDQPKPDLGSQSGTVQTNPDGTTDVDFGPTAPTGRRTTSSKRSQTLPQVEER
jgi:hypothetical protein